MDEWLTWRRPELIDAFRNHQFLREDTAPIYTEAGLPEALLFGLLATESEGKVHAYSRSGAMGPMQIMPHTALRYGLRTVDEFDTRLDPVLSAQASVKYLKRQLSRMGGDLTLALVRPRHSLRRPPLLALIETLRVDRPVDRVGMHSELRRNRSDLPVLRKKTAGSRPAAPP